MRLKISRILTRLDNELLRLFVADLTGYNRNTGVFLLVKSRCRWLPTNNCR